MSRQLITHIDEFNLIAKTNYHGLQNVIFKDYDFDIDINLTNDINVISFANCTFRKDLMISTTIEKDALLDNCVFEKQIEIRSTIFKGKARFISCVFNTTKFNLTTFKSTADFSNSTFYKPITFYKISFKDIVDFSAVNFKENVLFTYTSIEKLMVLRGAYPEKGFDISLAIITGELSVFDFQFDDYKSYTKIYKDLDEEFKKHNNNISYQNAYQVVYNKAVSQNHNIPIENKRETYRLLKNQLESQKNYIDSIPFRVMENKTLLKESWKKLRNGVNLTRSFSNIIVMSLNAISNWFGSSYLMGLLFTVSIAGLFFSLSLNHIGNYEFTTTISDWEWRYFVQYLNPTHRFDYMKLVDVNPRQWFFIWDFIGRVFVGYGIYQTITAFRKYK